MTYELLIVIIPLAFAWLFTLCWFHSAQWGCRKTIMEIDKGYSTTGGVLLRSIFDILMSVVFSLIIGIVFFAGMLP